MPYNFLKDEKMHVYITESLLPSYQGVSTSKYILKDERLSVGCVRTKFVELSNIKVCFDFLHTK